MKSQSSQLVDEILVMDAQDGNRRAMDKLVERWQKRLWAHAYRLTSDPLGAWDVTQQTWMGIIKGLRKLRDPARFKSWAYRIATHKAIDFIKAKQPTQPLPERPLEDTRSPQRKDLSLEELLGKLAPIKRAVLSLYYLESFTITEIAAALRIPKGTVKSRLHNAE